ncbi:ATP-binding protein, partial [Streptomyces sp. NPDC058953]|uniref:ATP-binding protein n=1 Tax=Streptomyces sp. NPDC058953 TaxID=3346676 RepID=UPI0036A9CF06
LRAVVDWSWDLLDHAERTVLRRLSVFAGGCDALAAEAVCGPDSGTGPPDVLAVLGSLIDKSLVVAEPSDGPDGSVMRYRLLETVAEYAAERLADAGERDTVQHRHLVHFRELARTTDPLLRGPRQLAALRLLHQEYENLRTALRRAVAARDEEEALCLVMSLAWYWQLKDLRSESHHWSTATRELGPDPFAPGTPPAGPVPERFTDTPPPKAAPQLAEARRANELLRIVSASRDADVWTSPEQLARLRRVTEVYRPGLPQLCRYPASMWFFGVLLTGDLERLREVFDVTVRACRESGYEWELASVVQMRAGIVANEGTWTGDALGDADEALEIFTRLGDVWGTAEALSARAEAREQRGDHAGAAEDFHAAVGHAGRVGADGQVALLRARYGAALTELGGAEAVRGETILREVVEAQGDRIHEANAVSRILLGLWLGRTGRRDEARSLLGGVVDLFGGSMLLVFEGMVQGYVAWLDHLDGRHRDALAGAVGALRAAMQPLCATVAPQLVAAHAVTVAGTLAAARPERVREAVLLLAAADARRPGGARPRSGWELDARLGVEAELRAALGDDAFTEAYGSGGAPTRGGCPRPGGAPGRPGGPAGV